MNEKELIAASQDMQSQRSLALDSRNKPKGTREEREERQIRNEQNKLGPLPKPTAIEVLKSWCAVEAGYVSRMMPESAKNGDNKQDITASDDYNHLIGEAVLMSRSRMRLMVFHCVDRGFEPETFRLYDEPIAPEMAKECRDFGLTHDMIKRACWENLLRLIEKQIARTPARQKPVATGEEVVLPKSITEINLNPAAKRTA